MILVFGKTGQLGGELAVNSGVKALSRAEVDLSQPKTCQDIIMDIEPAAVINAAAYTAVDKAENNEAGCFRINCDAPAEMAEACNILQVPFIHISSDYIFNGAGTRPFRETDTPSPINVYGRSKLAGEREVMDAYADAVILRTSWVFSSRGQNFVKTIAALSLKNKDLSIVADQIGGPSSAAAISKACLKIIDFKNQGKGTSGIFHFSGFPYVSWAEFAEIICLKLNRETRIRPIPSSDYPTLATRPLNSRMDCALIKKEFDIDAGDWQKDLDQVLQEME